MSNSFQTLFNDLTIGGGKDYGITMSESSKRGRPVSAQKLSRSKKAMSASEAEIQQVWDYWVSKMRATSKRKPVLDSSRRQFIGAAIFDYELQGCLDAIDGCAMSEFHMGRNKMNKRYDSIELIFRDAEHIEKFHDILDKSTQEKEDW
jgi:ribonucleotide reductase beta subunit family protein with ferritin-like domain